MRPTLQLSLAFALAVYTCGVCASQQLVQPAGGARRLLQPGTNISVTGWPSSSTGTIASNLAALLVDTGKFTIASASYAGDKSCAGKAYFKYYGVSTIPNRGGPDPGHFLAPWFKPSTASGVTNGVSAVMLSTAKILGSTFYHGNHLPLSTVKGANSTEIPGNVRSTKLTLRLTALANGYLRMPWTWSDAGLYSEIWFEGYGSDDRNLMRILVDGVDRAVTSDNRYVRHSSFWEQNPNPNDVDPFTVGDVSWVYHDPYGYYTPTDDPTLSIEFGGIAFMYNTKRLLVKKGQSITVTFMLGDMADDPESIYPEGPTALYLKPKSITLTSVTSCSSSTPCSSSSTQRCCGGFCCSTTVKCCSGECCASDGFNCLPFVLGGKSSCCSKSATCNGATLCCPPGSRCVNGTSCQQ